MTDQNKEPMPVSDQTPLRLKQELKADDFLTNPKRLQQESDADDYLQRITSSTAASAAAAGQTPLQIQQSVEISKLLERIESNTRETANAVSEIVAGQESNRPAILIVAIGAIISTVVTLLYLFYFIIVRPHTGI